MRARIKLMPTVSLILILIVSVAQAGQFEKNGPVGTRPLPVVIAGDSNQTITVNGTQRSYILHIPPGYNSSARLPLVLVLHAMGGTAKSIEDQSGMSAKADHENFIVVYPSALGDPSVWNTNLEDVSSMGVDDVGFIRALIDRLEQDLRINPNRVFSCGFSSGAVMSYLLGAKLSHRLAAIGIASGTIGHAPEGGPIRMIPAPSEPVPVIAFHGKQDDTIKYDGGGANASFSVARSIAFWVKADGCGSSPQTTTRQQGNLTIDDYGGCRDRSEVVLYSFGNGTHEWPTPQNNDHYSATDAMWEFFASHPRR